MKSHSTSAQAALYTPCTAHNCTSITLCCCVQGAEGLKPPPLISVSPSSTLRQVLALLAGNMLHRLHVLDERSRPVGIITITDLLRLIVGATELLEAYGPVRAGRGAPWHAGLLDQGSKLIHLLLNLRTVHVCSAVSYVLAWQCLASAELVLLSKHAACACSFNCKQQPGDI